MDLTDLLSADFIRELLSTSGKASLTEKLILIGVIWKVMGRKVADHFKSLESGMKDGFAKLTKSVDDVKEALREVESTHSLQISELSTRVEKLEKKQL